MESVEIIFNIQRLVQLFASSLSFSGTTSRTISSNVNIEMDDSINVLWRVALEGINSSVELE